MDNFLTNDYYQDMIIESENMVKKMADQKNDLLCKVDQIEDKLRKIEDEYKEKSGEEGDVVVLKETDVFRIVSPEEYLKEEMEDGNKLSKKRKLCTKYNKRENLDDMLNTFENTVKEAVNKTVTTKVKRDTSIVIEEYDSTDGILKDGVEFITKKIEDIKNSFKDIIGTDLITMIAQVVKTMNQHVKNGRNVTIPYIKRVLELIRNMTENMTALTIL